MNEWKTEGDIKGNEKEPNGGLHSFFFFLVIRENQNEIIIKKNIYWN